VARYTGLSADVIRTWERRYHVVTPMRSPTGRRLYSDRDIERLRLLAHAARAGRSIGQIAGLDEVVLAKLVNDLAGAHPGPEPDESGPPRSLSLCLKAIEAFDIVELDAELRRAAIALSADTFIDTLVVPLHATVVNCTRAGTLHTAHERVVGAVLRRVLDRIVDAATPSLSDPDLIVSTPLGQTRELGALVVAATAAAEGWRPLYLGSGLSAEAIAEVTMNTPARAVALSLGDLPSDHLIPRELRRLRSLLATTVPILVEGAPHAHGGMLREIGAVVLRDAAALRAWLRTKTGEAREQPTQPRATL